MGQQKLETQEKKKKQAQISRTGEECVQTEKVIHLVTGNTFTHKKLCLSQTHPPCSSITDRMTKLCNRLERCYFHFAPIMMQENEKKKSGVCWERAMLHMF